TTHCLSTVQVGVGGGIDRSRTSTPMRNSCPRARWFGRTEGARGGRPYRADEAPDRGSSRVEATDRRSTAIADRLALRRSVGCTPPIAPARAGHVDRHTYQ